ncbi:MAG TPA: substrate-binding domain-containing protein [Solirubrobacterales bacterium]|jgi:ABC-type sugar transport system substrate-binding protein|nr:substrate-binding domain-containing protein [Solirubrobacterales bacterium]
MGKWIRHALIGTVLVAALVVAGCGSSGGSSSSDSGGSSSEAGGNSIKPATIALVDLQASSPVDLACDEAVKAAAKELGWTVNYTDAGGEPEKASAAIAAAVTSGVDGIITTSGEASYFRQPLTQAQSKGIPAINIGGGSADPLYTAAYVEELKPIATGLDEYLLEQNPKAQIGAIEASITKNGAGRLEDLEEQVAAHPGAKIVDSEEPNIAQPSSYEKTVTDMLTAHPEIDTIWSVFDNFTQPSAQAIEAKHSDAKLYSFYVSPPNLELLEKESPLEAVADNKLPVTGVMAVDQLLHNFQEGREIEADYLEKHPLKVKIFTRENLAQAKTDWSAESLLAPFLAEWEKQYTGLAG